MTTTGIIAIELAQLQKPATMMFGFNYLLDEASKLAR